jgi:galactokinase
VSEGALARRALDGFSARFGRTPDLLAFAPGRVNLIGEHTDYNEGFVLPMALHLGTVVALRTRADNAVYASAPDVGTADAQFTLAECSKPDAPGHWSNHVRGIFAARAAAGLPNRGVDMLTCGNLPQGAGLSSSASLGVALALGLATLNGEAADAGVLARLAQWSEHHVVGCECGIMDQLIAAAGVAGHALLIDCRDLALKPVRMLEGLAVVVVHSGVERGLVDSEYNTRRRECESSARHYGVTSLRELTAEALYTSRGALAETPFRRARHVVTENARTLGAARALEDGDLAQLGALLRASHASLRDDFAVSVPPVDALAETMNAAIGEAGGARMTGGGFGGCLVALLPGARVGKLRQAVEAHFAALGRQTPLFLVTAPGAGARVLAPADITP